MKLHDLAKKRRSIYHLGKDIDHSHAELYELIKKIVSESPSSFNSQSSRVLVLFGDEHEALWDMTRETLREIVPADSFEATNAKMDAFKAARGTVLFYEDQEPIKALQEQFPLYADKFPIWSEHSTAIAQYAVWMALAEHDIGASLQHYNPLIDAAVAERWDIPSNWVLTAQMPFGSIETPAAAKDYMDEADRFRAFGL
ncbi:nitroreductase family protein [Oligella urethralis]|uniref:nitroreductase family protein n=1 Tax=Oligella urethralis TaxID=90245 RepID=UPI00242C85A6|nr:nitroreductase family protein [Oligella urethralis]